MKGGGESETQTLFPVLLVPSGGPQAETFDSAHGTWWSFISEMGLTILPNSPQISVQINLKDLCAMCKQSLLQKELSHVNGRHVNNTC